MGEIVHTTEGLGINKSSKNTLSEKNISPFLISEEIELNGTPEYIS